MPIRIQRQRSKGWRLPPGAVYVGRPTRWGNPYELHRYDAATSLALYRNTVTGTWSPTLAAATPYPAEAVYQEHLAWRARFRNEHPLEALHAELRGKDLACWCPLDDLGCHVPVLLDLANR